VATVATVVVIACYVAAAFSLNLLVASRLTAQADARLTVHLDDAATKLPVVTKTAASTSGDGDIDDAPIFLWTVKQTGTSTALTAGSPQLPQRTWTGDATTVEIGGTSFRFDAVKSNSEWLVAGESVGQLQHVHDALLAPELLFGMALLIVVYAGSLVIGLRASAPLEIIQRRQAEFTADASHELRTPLSVIEAEVELSLSRPRPPEEYQAVLRRIAGEGHRLRRIVDDLLWLARADDDGSSAQKQQFTDIGAMAQACAERFRPIAGARNVSLSVSVEGGESQWVQADSTWIDRLMVVLVDNACKYAGTGGSVEVRVRGTGSQVVLQVDDSGPGIPADQRVMVFDRFHRGTVQLGGVGLGLAIADSVVRATEGTWSIGTAPSGGARMEVSWRRISGRRLNYTDPTAEGNESIAPVSDAIDEPAGSVPSPSQSQARDGDGSPSERAVD
jgi:signal transduction histidine kinase